MTTDVDIVNAGLIKLGEATITTLADDVKPARLANAIFADQRDVVLRAHPWNFAMVRAELTAHVTPPLWGFANAYDLPGDPDFCLRVISVEGEADEGAGAWKIEARQIVTDLASPIRILYLRRVSDYGLWDALSLDALAARIAMELAEPLGKSTSLHNAMARLYDNTLRAARSADGQEGTAQMLAADGWLEARI
ncbi:MAG: hypothetical protein HOL07_11190 [Rhodospirillaceae bacterium]|jgi:hypothetical protein|nr:hypothetical protein [Rhodospirillaceae bacterium]MBT4773670.1 hypothetical protein [Rhodospirillaceae bacterium]MBT5358899.1 hypothetical protein [Rhodospirillaceae bacterium]MBT5770156.1 hypothetical protein [Rhodospirillaceae bacterium]MBT6310956.1 hypothetical protein [Rhodospirillaceae bacterium]